MKPHTQAVREAQAWNRILLAIKKRAKAENADASGLDVTNRDPALQQMFRMEALADFLEAGDKPAEPVVKDVSVQMTKLETGPSEQPASVTAKPAKAAGEGGKL